MALAIFSPDLYAREAHIAELKKLFRFPPCFHSRNTFYIFRVYFSQPYVRLIHIRAFNHFLSLHIFGRNVP